MISACGPSEVSVETRSDGRYGGKITNLLCSGLQGEACDLVGQITLASLYTLIDQRLGDFNSLPLIVLFNSKHSSALTICTVKNPTRAEISNRVKSFIFLIFIMTVYFLSKKSRF